MSALKSAVAGDGTKSAVAGEGTSETSPASPGAVRLAELVRASDSVVALTGAGISVPSGIPDFRSPGTGLWEKVDPMEVAHIDVFRRDPERFWSFYGERFQTLEHRSPNPAHVALAELECAGRCKAVITQNIDRLHAKAGTRRLIEVHGSIDHSSCPGCGERYGLGDVGARRRADAAGVPRCDCGRALKPGVVLFGELLPEDALRQAQQLAADADLMVCVGSSLEVYPVAELPTLTIAGGGRLAIVTQGATPFDAQATVRCEGDVVDELGAVVRLLRVG
jgi:NAD-dependent deacetylase